MKHYYLKNQLIGLLLCSSMLTAGVLQAQCTEPTIGLTSGPGIICTGETATLIATHDGEEVKWYDAATGGNELATGDTFITEVLTTDTSFWAEAINISPGTNTTTVNAARLAPESFTQYSLDNSGCGLVIDATEDFTLNSFEVYHDGTGGSTTVELRDSSGTVVNSHDFTLPSGNGTTPHLISVDFEFMANESYWLIQTPDFKMVRELGGSLPDNYYPLAIDDVASITSALLNGSPGSQNYYFFYNWEITIAEDEICSSDRVEEIVIVNETTIPTGDLFQQFDTGETLANLDVTGQDLQWYVDAAGTNPLPETTPLVDNATYYVSQTLTFCESELLEITVTENLGVSNSAFSGLVAYPSLVENQLFIENNETITRVEIYNLLGQLLMEKNIHQLKTSMDMTPLSTGVQLVKIFTANETKTIRVIKK